MQCWPNRMQLPQDRHLPPSPIPGYRPILSTADILMTARRVLGLGLSKAARKCPFPLQPIWRLQVNDQDLAAGSGAKNSLGANSMELAGLVAKETATERATKQEKVSDIHRESKRLGWGTQR